MVSFVFCALRTASLGRFLQGFQESSNPKTLELSFIQLLQGFHKESQGSQIRFHVLLIVFISGFGEFRGLPVLLQLGLLVWVSS